MERQSDTREFKRDLDKWITREDTTVELDDEDSDLDYDDEDEDEDDEHES